MSPSRTAIQQLTDTTIEGPVFFIAALPWTRRAEEGEPEPIRRISLHHTTQTLADYATLDQLDRHVSMGYNSLLIGQRIGLMRAGEAIAAWPVDNTGWPWTGTRDNSAVWAFRADPERRAVREGASAGFVVAHGSLTDVLDEVATASVSDPETTIVIAGQCLFEAHWH